MKDDPNPGGQPDRASPRSDRILQDPQIAQRWLAAIVEWSDDAIVSKDLNGIVTSWNRGAVRLFCYEPEEIIGHSIRSIVPPDRQDEEADILRRIHQGEIIAHFETIRQRKDGAPVPVALTVSPIRTEQGEIVGISKIARDISEQRRDREAAADLQRRLMGLVSASQFLLASPRLEDALPATLKLARDLIEADGYAIWRRDTPTGAWNVEAHEGLSQRFAAEVLVPGAPLTSELIAAEDAQSLPLLESRRAAYRSEGIQSLMAVPMIVGESITGTIAWYYRTRHAFNEVERETARALANLASAALRTALLYDEQRWRREQADFLARAGVALGSSLDYQRTLKTLADLAVPRIADWCAIDMSKADGTITTLAVKHADPERAELARRLFTQYPLDPRSPYGVHEVLRSGRPLLMGRIPDDLLVEHAVDEEHLRLLRALKVISYMCVPLRTNDRIAGVLTFISTQSGRRYGEPDLRFAEAVATRAGLALENAMAYEEVRRANRLKDEFLGTLSHELRTPLNAILGYARMLRTGTLPAGRRDPAIETIERNATALAQMVEDVLEVSRIVAGKIRLNVRAVDLPRVVREAIETIRPAADAKDIRLQILIDPAPVPVSGDPDRLQQIVWNLLSNAVKFTPRGGRVQVRVERVNSHVEIVVSDTGRGIPAEFLPHVFERFRQADSRFAREFGGLGLGLALARSLTELHGGIIQAASDGDGTGATFRVRLPVRIVHQESFEEPIRVHPQAGSGVIESPQALLTDIRVLAVDDEADALALVRETLEAAGAGVATVCSGDAALKAVEAHLPDVLLVDIGMPGMDGFELIQRIRNSVHQRIRHVPAAALTAYARSDDRTRALRSGFDLHLAKPIDPGELIAAVEALTRVRGASREARSDGP